MTEPSYPVGLVENFIHNDTQVALVVADCWPGNIRQTTVQCIDVTNQPQELHTGNILGIFMPLEEDQICEGSREVIVRGPQLAGHE